MQKEQGKLKLEDKVSQYLPDFRIKEYENITINQLLNHTSGLNIMGNRLMFRSGTGFFYSNDGFNALGQIFEKVSGKSYDENVKELFSKIGMQHSSTASTFKTEILQVHISEMTKFRKLSPICLSDLPEKK